MHTVVDLMAERKDDEVRKRNKEIPSWAPGGADYDPNLPYGPKVYVARRKKPDPWWVTTIEVRAVHHDVQFKREDVLLFNDEASLFYPQTISINFISLFSALCVCVLLTFMRIVGLEMQNSE